MPMKIRSFAALAGAVTMLAGCAGMQRALPETPATPQALEQLQQVRDQYAAGHYGEVVRQVAKSDELAGSTGRCASRPTSSRPSAIASRATPSCAWTASPASWPWTPRSSWHPMKQATRPGDRPSSAPGAGRTLRPAPRESRPRKSPRAKQKGRRFASAAFLFPPRAGLRARSCPKAPLIRRRPRRPDRRQGRPHRNPP